MHVQTRKLASSHHHTPIAQAIQTYEQNSCISFVQRTNEVDYVRFFKGRGYGLGFSYSHNDTVHCMHSSWQHLSILCI